MNAPALDAKPGSAGPRGRLMLWLGNGYLVNAMRKLGWRVIHHDFVPGEVHTWESVLALCGGEIPDLVFLVDPSASPAMVGMERFPCLTAFYAIDSHIHSWYPFYAQAFDLVLLSLRDDLPRFQSGRSGSSVWWSPPSVPDHYRPPEPLPEPEWDMIFVGTVIKERAPKRHAFLAKVKEGFPALHVTSGSYAELYPKAKLVLNECSNNELNFRVFEALALGSCLLTPDIGPALTDLFSDGRDLFLYPTHDVDALLAVARRLLDDDALRRRVAASGLALVDAKYRESIRAAELNGRLRALYDSGEAEAMIKKRLKIAPELFNTCLRFIYLLHAESAPDENLKKTYLNAATQNSQLP